MAEEDCLKRWLNRTLEVQEPELQFLKHLHWGSLLIKGSSRSDLITDLDEAWTNVKIWKETSKAVWLQPGKPRLPTKMEDIISDWLQTSFLKSTR